MSGHFENGIWIKESSTKENCLVYTIKVDTSQVKELETKLKEMRDLFAVPDSMTTIWQRLRWLVTGRVS